MDLTVWVNLDFCWFSVFRFALEGVRTASKVGSSCLVFSQKKVQGRKTKGWTGELTEALPVTRSTCAVNWGESVAVVPKSPYSQQERCTEKTRSTMNPLEKKFLWPR